MKYAEAGFDREESQKHTDKPDFYLQGIVEFVEVS